MLSKFSAKFISWPATTGTWQERNERSRTKHEDAGNALNDFHRKMDPKDLVLAEREASSIRGVAPRPRERLPAHAHQNSSQSRIDGIDRQAGDEIEGYCCRVFVDSTGEDNDCATQRYVPLWAQRYSKHVSADVHLAEETANGRKAQAHPCS